MTTEQNWIGEILNTEVKLWNVMFFDPQDQAWVLKMVCSTEAEASERIAGFIPAWNKEFAKHQISGENFRVEKDQSND